jgi:lipopolysaccharide biosynthesis regulator YciM
VLNAITELAVVNGTQNGETGTPSLHRYLSHLQKHPSLMAASRWLSTVKPGQTPLPEPVQKALDHATKPLARYRCAACGFEAKEHYWHCPGCQAWDSYPPRRIEEI